MIDVEKMQTPMKSSFLRKWGPALIAIAGVVTINVALLGPMGHKIPELSKQSLNARKLGEERTAAVLEMKYDLLEDHKLGRGFGSRNLSNEEGGVMEYTRRRR